MKEVSIIIPAVTWEPFTEECIKACAALFPEASLILVLDSELPITVTVPRLTVMYGQTGTISRKRNVAVALASTTYIAFIDSDAYPHKDWLNNAIAILNSDNKVGLVGGPNISPPSESLERKLVGMSIKSWLVAGKWNFYKFEHSPARYCDNLPSCNLILRKDMYVELNGMNETLEVGEDTDFCARLIQHGYKVFFHPCVIVYHYDRKILAYFRQRMVRGAGVFLHIFGHSAQKNSWYTYLMLQPVFALLFWLSFPIVFIWSTWLFVFTLIAVVYVLLIVIESYKCSDSFRYIPAVSLLILAGNVLPGVGFLMKMVGAFPSLQSFYRNDE